jgi:hypothetical protein
MDDSRERAIERLKELRGSREESRERSRARRRRGIVMGTASLVALGVLALVLSTFVSASRDAGRTETRLLSGPAHGIPQVGAADIEPELVQVGEDLVANPPPGAPLDSLTYPDGVLAATSLGSPGGNPVYGILTDRARVCMIINDVEGGSGRCIPYAQFVDEGFLMDRGSYEIHWLPDGTVEWTGI